MLGLARAARAGASLGRRAGTLVQTRAWTRCAPSALAVVRCTARRQSSTATAYDDVFRHLRDPDAALTVQFNSRLVRLLAPKNSADLERQNGRRAFELWREAQTQGVVPNLMTYNFLIRAANMAQEPLEVALDLFQRLLDEGLQPTRFTYNALLMNCARLGCVAEAEEVFETMVSSLEDPPDLLSHHHVVLAYARGGALRKATAHLARMREQGLSANADMCKQVAETALHLRQNDTAVAMLEEMAQSPEPVDVPLLMRCFLTCASEIETANVLRLYELCKSITHRIDDGALLVAMNAAARAADAQLGETLYEDAVAGRRVSPELSNARVQLHGTRRTDDALPTLLEAVKEAVDRGFLLEPGTLRTVARRIGQQPSRMRQLVDLLRRERPVPGEMVTIAMRACANSASCELALDLVGEIRELTNDSPSVYMLEAVTHVFAQPGSANGRHVRRLMDLFAGTYGVQPSSEVMENFIVALVRSKHTKEAMQELRSMLDKGERPTPFTFETLIIRYAIKGRPDRARWLLDQLNVAWPLAGTVFKMTELVEAEAESRQWSTLLQGV
mmetsp:Transcript_9987/g.31458  ORF Transcript_9987/g.31458 Transcript_9987/m.31458 type:complete len:560 (+) Transcript_9987:3-1682(+)